MEKVQEEKKRQAEDILLFGEIMEGQNNALTSHWNDQGTEVDGKLLKTKREIKDLVEKKQRTAKRSSSSKDFRVSKVCFSRVYKRNGRREECSKMVLLAQQCSRSRITNTAAGFPYSPPFKQSSPLSPFSSPSLQHEESEKSSSYCANVKKAASEGSES